MRASSIVTQLRLRLPQLTPEFTNEIPVISLARVGTRITAACQKAHGLAVGNAVVIVGAVVPIPISSFTRSGAVGTIVTTTDHDLTDPIALTITTSGAVEAEFNGTFTRTSVVNRRTITVVMADAGPAAATGSPVLENGESALRQYDSVYKVEEVLNAVTFTFENSVAGLPDPIGTIVARTTPRISAAVNPEKTLAAYTENKIGDFWLFVVLESVPASKNRNVGGDVVDNQQRGNEFRQQISQGFTVYLFIPASDDVGAAGARDQAEDLFRPICRSLLFSSFDSGLFVGSQNPVQFVSHETFDYNQAVYVHAFSFQQAADLVFEDTVGDDLDVAFRNIDLTMDPDLGGITTLGAVIDLDDTSL